MYILTRAYARRNRRNGRWEELDLSETPVHTLPITHGDVFLFITYPSYDGERAVRFDDVANWTGDVAPTTTVQAWLTSLGNRTLPFRDQLPTFRTGYVHYTQVWCSNYDVQPISRLGTVEQGGSKWDKEDLLIRRSDLDPEYLGKHALFTVNGFFHMHDTGPQGCHVLDGNRTLRTGNDNQIGLYSFADVGEIQCVAITDEMIANSRDDEPLRKGTYVTLPDSVDLTDKTLLLSVGGYLQVLGKGYTRVGERAFRIELSNLLLPERYFQSYDQIDLSSLGLTHYEENPSLLAVSEMVLDSTIRAYLTLPQSFFVVVHSPSFFHELVALESSGLPSRYLTDDPTPYPVIGAYGRSLEHHTIVEDGLTVVATSANQRHRYDHHRRPWKSLTATDGGRYPAHPFDEAQAYHRVMGVQHL